MAQISIAMPADLQHWVDARVTGGRYLDAGEYLRDLIRRDQEDGGDCDEADEMRALVAEGDASGVSAESPLDVLRRVIAGAEEPRG